MKSHGNKYIRVIIVAIMFSCQIYGQNIDYCYYLSAYQNDDWPTDILFEKIDLNSKSIINSVPIRLTGELQAKNPIPLSLRNQTIYFISTINGLPAKNCEYLNRRVANYAILNTDGVLIQQGQMPYFQILDYKILARGMVEINYSDSLGMNSWGNLSIINGATPHVNFTRRAVFDSINYPTISNFRYMNKIIGSNSLLYWVDNYSGRYILKLNYEQRILIDSLKIDSTNTSNHIIGIGNGDSVIYSFYLNYNIVGGPESTRKTSVDSSYLKLFRISDFSFIDSIPINNPANDSDIVGNSNGPCDRIGPYFVYYFFNGEDYRYFSSAMLFIFDTRTNEARWLRVGWR
jgi:hypothetical protein